MTTMEKLGAYGAQAQPYVTPLASAAAAALVMTKGASAAGLRPISKVAVAAASAAFAGTHHVVGKFNGGVAATWLANTRPVQALSTKLDGKAEKPMALASSVLGPLATFSMAAAITNRVWPQMISVLSKAPEKMTGLLSVGPRNVVAQLANRTATSISARFALGLLNIMLKTGVALAAMTYGPEAWSRFNAWVSDHTFKPAPFFMKEGTKLGEVYDAIVGKVGTKSAQAVMAHAKAHFVANKGDYTDFLSQELTTIAGTTCSVGFAFAPKDQTASAVVSAKYSGATATDTDQFDMKGANVVVVPTAEHAFTEAEKNQISVLVGYAAKSFGQKPKVRFENAPLDKTMYMNVVEKPTPAVPAA